ncbi:MAG: ABC transporter permease [Deltaproteobacteria bacterium]|jgi:peptide/nickel transport system permease protein|nr:ABC transporter permease [Deltaproteobacteria bacterium]
MISYLIKRVFQMVVVLWVVSIIVFTMMSFTGDPTYMMVPLDATEDEIANARMLLGLDKPYIVQYGIFLKNILGGDFGRSFVFRQPALGLIMERMPATVEMVLVAMTLALLLAIPLGVFAGAYPQKKTSRGIMAGSLLGISLPNFWVGMMLIFILAVRFNILPSSGRGDTLRMMGVNLSILTPDGFKHIILPAVTLCFSTLAILLRITRAGMMEVMKQDFIKFARAKGATFRSVLFKHALKNVLIPVVTIFGLQLGDLIGFATITEYIFAWPGMGKLLIDSIYMGDRPVIVVYLMFVAFLFVIINFTVDVIYTLIDPRIKLR